MLYIIGCGFIAAALFIIFSGIIGLFRFPDFYSKLHASGLIDAFGVPLALVGLAALQVSTSPANSFKLFCAALLLLILSPVTTHALCRASLGKDIALPIKSIDLG